MANKTFIAGEDLTGKVGYAVKYDSGIKVGAGFGILMNDNKEGKAVGVALTGEIVPAKVGEAVKIGDKLKAGTDGKLMKATGTDAVIAIAVEDGALGALALAVIV